MGVKMTAYLILARGSDTSSQKRNSLRKKSLADRRAVLLIWAFSAMQCSVKESYMLVRRVRNQR